MNYCVKGVIDRKFKDASRRIEKINTVPMISLESIKQVEAEDVAVIICLNNGIEHEKVAAQLFTFGFMYILYLPMSMILPINDQRILRQGYRDFVDDFYEKIQIHKYYDKKNRFKLINVIEHNISFWCPKCVLRTGSISEYRHAAEYRNLNNKYFLLKYSNCRIDEFKPHVDLFLSLGGRDESCAREYLLMQRNTDYERIKLYDDRKVLFGIYEDRFRYDMTFFWIALRRLGGMRMDGLQ